MGATVADGWYAGKIGLFSNQMYGDQTSLWAWLLVEPAGENSAPIVTDGQWKGTLEGPIRAADILDGEMIDARREMAGWDRPGFDDASWQAVKIVEAPKAALVAQPNEPIRITQEVRPVAITEPAPGVYVADFGQNLPGVIRLHGRGTAGTEVTVRHGEMLDDSGRLYTANLRSAAQTDRFILSGNDDVFEPRFTYHGLRYAEITGLPSRPTEGDLIARVLHSDPPGAGIFECSDPMLNRLMSNIRWTQYANMMSVPTDCPQRDERLGWMGDAHIFAQTAIYNLDMAGFLAKWCRDIRDAQGADGRYSDFSPNPVLSTGKFTSVPGWGDAGVTAPWRLYENYRDTRVLAEHYDSARRWIEYIRGQNPGLIWERGRGNDYGDWLNGDTLKLEGFPAKGAEVPKEIFATVCFEQSTRLVSRMAEALKKEDDAAAYRDLADRIRTAFRERFIAADGAMPGDTQAGYALALHFGLAPEAQRPAMVSRLLAAIDRYKGRLSTGFHSTVPMMEALVASGHADTAYRLLTSTEFPGWGFMIEQGATSMWERWDGYVKGRGGEGGGTAGFQDPGMNSFNHFAFGAIGEWMVRHIGGIQADPAAAGWSHFIIAPAPGGGLTWAKARYRSIHGEIASSWRLEGGRLVLEVVIPANTSATIVFPTGDPSSLREGDRGAAEAEGLVVGGVSGGAVRVEAGAGAYRLSGAAPR
jgi:alpha-L-rhamnosidase